MSEFIINDFFIFTLSSFTRWIISRWNKKIFFAINKMLINSVNNIRSVNMAYYFIYELRNSREFIIRIIYCTQ